jgi:hypothetical protein
MDHSPPCEADSGAGVGISRLFIALKSLLPCLQDPASGPHIRDSRRPDFGGTVPILRAVFRVSPGYMAGHTFVPLFETFGLH